MKKIDIITLFPEYFNQFTSTSIIKRAIDKQIVEINCIQLRDFSFNKNKRVDDYPTGGGAGMVLQCQPVVDAINKTKKMNSKVYLLSARGKLYNQQMAKELSKESHIILVCGHYEGIDERINDYIDEEICIGDYVLTGGETAAMVVADSVIRLMDGAISTSSTEDESFENGLLEYPQYTFPRDYEGKKIPDILFSGNHQAIKEWRFKQSYLKTKQNRPDLLKNKEFNEQEKKWINAIDKKENEQEAIIKAKKFMK